MDDSGRLVDPEIDLFRVTFVFVVAVECSATPPAHLSDNNNAK